MLEAGFVRHFAPRALSHLETCDSDLAQSALAVSALGAMSACEAADWPMVGRLLCANLLLPGNPGVGSWGWLLGLCPWAGSAAVDCLRAQPTGAADEVLSRFRLPGAFALLRQRLAGAEGNRQLHLLAMSAACELAAEIGCAPALSVLEDGRPCDGCNSAELAASIYLAGLTSPSSVAPEVRR